MPSFGLNVLPTTALVQAILDVDTHTFSESIPMDVDKETGTRSFFLLGFFFDRLTLFSSHNVISA